MVDLLYLRRLANVSPDWVIDVIEESLHPNDCAELRWALRPQPTAQIILNTLYTFSEAARLRTITHELLELSLLDMWILSYQAIGQIGKRQQRDAFDIRIRAARDAYIERRLREMPFWSTTDVPIPAKALEESCLSPLRVPKDLEKAPRRSSYARPSNPAEYESS